MDLMLSRYRRHMALAGFEEEGQRRLLKSNVVIMGCGGLGSFAALLLARAGVGHLTLVDRDRVERHNLHRQVLYEDADCGRLKVEAAREKLLRANPEVRVDAVMADVSEDNVEALVEGADLVMDGADNFEMRLLFNAMCVKHDIVWVHGAIVGAYGLQMTVIPGETACLACLLPDLPEPGAVPTAETAGTLSSAVAVVAAYQVTEAIKVLTGNLHRVRRTLMSFDLWENTRAEVTVRRRVLGDPCPVCVGRVFTDILQARS